MEQREPYYEMVRTRLVDKKEKDREEAGEKEAGAGAMEEKEEAGAKE